MIKDITQGIVLAKNKKFCKDIFSKARGLMFSKKLKDIGLIFVFDKEKIISLHMAFVFYPIDVLFLNKNKRVVEIKSNFRPFSFYKSRNRAKYVLELPLGSIKKVKIKDKISF